MDETYIKIKGEWHYLYRAIDKAGKTIDFMLSEKRDCTAAKRFFEKAIESCGMPEKINMDKSGANAAGLEAINFQLLMFFMIFGGDGHQIVMRQVK